MDDGPEGQDKKQDSLHGVRASPPCGHHRRSTSRLRWCCYASSQSHGELITRHRPISTCCRPYRNPQSVLTGTPRFCAHSRRRDTGSRMVVLVDRHRSTQAGSSSNLGPSVACFFTHQIHVPDRLLTEHRRISPRSSRAHYTRGTMNWQQGFGLIYIDRKRVQPVAIPIEKDGSFLVEGKRYG